MRALVKTGVSAIVIGLGMLACSNTAQPMQAIVASNVQPRPGSGTCNSPEKFVYLPESAIIPGPDTASDANIVQTNTGDVQIICSVIPSGSGFNVSATAQITGGVAPGTLTISGTFTPRVRDASGGTTTAGDAAHIPNITVEVLDPTKHLHETDCYATYTLVDNGAPGNSLPGPADVFANDQGGRIWASVFCPTPTNLLESQKPGNSGCEASMTFRFENCTSKAQ